MLLFKIRFRSGCHRTFRNQAGGPIRRGRILGRALQSPLAAVSRPSNLGAASLRVQCNFSIHSMILIVPLQESGLPFLNTPPKRIISSSASQRKGDSRVMANVNTKKGVIGILTGGGDVPGRNPAIRGVTL